jgi:hypothetical protein
MLMCDGPVAIDLEQAHSLSEQKTVLSTGLLDESGPHRDTAVSDTYLE